MLLLIAQIFPILLPWYADPNYEAIFDDEGVSGSYQEPSGIIIYKKKSKMYLIVSLFSVFANNHWHPIKDFISNECPYVMKSGFECLKMLSFQYAAFGVTIKHLYNCL